MGWFVGWDDGKTYLSMATERFRPVRSTLMIQINGRFRGLMSAKGQSPRDTALNFRNLPLTCELGPSLLRIVELLQQDPSRTWSLTDAAQSVGMSVRTLQRRLQEADLSFSRVTRLIRIQEASELLAKSDLPVTVIGFCAGFSDSAHFSRDFNLSTGMSPTAFRKLARASDASA